MLFVELVNDRSDLHGSRVDNRDHVARTWENKLVRAGASAELVAAS